MKNYELSKDEVILFKGIVTALTDWKDEKTAYSAELLLTNYNIVINSHTKKLFSTIVSQNVYHIDDIKVYDETVQIIRRRDMVDIYLAEKELFLRFEKEKQAKEFCDKAIKLKDGNSKFVRSVKKTQKVIRETNEALDIDLVEIAKGTASVACDLAIGIGSLEGAGRNTKILAKVAGVFQNKNKKDKHLQIAAHLNKDEVAEEDKASEITASLVK